jgi:hypothetical protein
MKLPDEKYRTDMEYGAAKDAHRGATLMLGAVVITVIIGAGFIMLIAALPSEMRFPALLIALSFWVGLWVLAFAPLRGSR